MATPPSPEPWKWIVLSKFPHTANQRNDVSVSDVSPPPRLSYLTVSSTRIFPAGGTQTQAAAANPRVLAADLSAGLFLLTSNPRVFKVLNTASPTRAYGVLVDHDIDPASLGIISEAAPNGRGFRVVGFR